MQSVNAYLKQTRSDSCFLVQLVEGIVVDVGWYRTTIRSFEREIFNIPNSVFSRNVVLNVTRKGKEWRFYEFVGKPAHITAAMPCLYVRTCLPCLSIYLLQNSF